MSAAKSSRRSAASFARRRAARARARGVVRSCGTGSDLHVGVGIGFDVGLLVIILDPETRSGFGVTRTENADIDAETRVDIFVWRYHSLLSDVRRVVTTTTITMMMSKGQMW